MSGVKGSGGPVPKRADQRRRRNVPAKSTTKAPSKTPTVWKPPAADRTWPAIVQRWYNSLAQSGQSEFYEPSDWSTAAIIAESMSREFKPQQMVLADGKIVKVERPPRAAAIAAWLKGMTALMVTEGDRRRLSMELHGTVEDSEEAGDVAWLDDARSRLRGPG